MRIPSLEIAAKFVTDTPADLIEIAAQIDAWLDKHGEPHEEMPLGRSPARQALEIAHHRAFVYSGGIETLLSYADAILKTLTPPAEHRISADAA